MVSTSLRRRIAAAALSLFCAMFLSTCDFLAYDIFPSWLTYVEARVDLRAILKAEGLGDFAEPLNVEYAPFDLGTVDYSKVLVIAAGNAIKKLFLLDPATLKIRNSINNHLDWFDKSLAAAANGFMCGWRIVIPTDTSVISSGALWTHPDKVRLFRDIIGGKNYAVDIDNSIKLTLIRYNSDFTLWDAQNPKYDDSDHEYDLLDAEFANGYSIMARHRIMYKKQQYASVYSRSDDTLFFDPGPIFRVPVSPEHTGPFPVSDEKAWLTEDGPVAFLRGDGKTDRITRYKYGTGQFSITFGDFSSGFTQAEELDSIPFDDDDELRVLSFDASGTWWFVYNARTGYLYKLRTWWK